MQWESCVDLAAARRLPAALAAVAILLAGSAASCVRSGNAEGPRRAAEGFAETPVAPVAHAQRASIAESLALTAEFEPFQEVDLMAKVSGYLKEIKVDIGDRVRAGQALATLEIPELEDDLARSAAAIDEAEAELATARDESVRAVSAHEIAHLSYTRILDVAKREQGLVPQQEVDEGRSRDLIAEAQVASAKSRVAASEQHIRVAKAEQARIRTLRQYTVITAPFDGVVTKRYANVGSMIQAATSSQTQAMPLVRVSQNSLLRLILPAPESAVAGVHVGQAVTVKVASLGRNFSGQVTRFANKLQMSTRTMDTEVDVPNPDLLLIPGMYAEVSLALRRHERAICVPPDAIEGMGTAAPRVYRVGAGGHVEVVKVSTGIETAQRVEILSGLMEGDAVVVGRHSDLAEGKAVRTRSIDLPERTR